MGPLHPGTAIDDFLAAYEAEHGEITGEQVVGAARRTRTRTRAVVVRGAGSGSGSMRFDEFGE